MDILSRRQHGMLDVAVVAAFAVGPALLGLSRGAALLSYGLAVVHLAMSVVTTGLPITVRPLVPLALHGLVEMAVGVVLAAVAWFGFDGADRGFHLVMAAVILSVFAVTSYLPDR